MRTETEKPPTHCVGRVDRYDARWLHRALLSATGLVLILAADPGLAQVIDVEWEGTSSDDWLDATNWDSGTIPASTENVGIDTVTPNPTTIDGASAVTRDVFVGFSDTGELSIVNSGTLDSRVGALGFASGSQGTATVSGTGSQWTNTDLLVVGVDGQGLLSIENQGLVTSAGGIIGLTEGEGTVTVNGIGSRWSIAGELLVGDGTYFPGGGGTGAGSLSITDGGRVESGSARIGNGPNAEGFILVDGASSLWTNTEMIVGFAGTGELTVSGGAAITTVDYGLLGQQEGSSGTVRLEGASNWTAGGIVGVGGEGNGFLTITSGASLDAPVVMIGQLGTSQSAVEVNGSGSALNTASGVIVGHRGMGELSILDNATVVSGNADIANRAGSEGQVSVGGGASWTNTNDITVAVEGTGTVSIDSGGVVSSLRGIIAKEAGSVGTVEIDGAGSAWTNGSDFFVGAAGDGSLAVTNGAQLANGHGYIGSDASGSGIATVSGGASWSNAGNLLVGDSGGGTLAVADGGTVNNIDAFLGTFDGAEGTVRVTGVGSGWTSTGTVNVGDAGTGALIVEGGGAADSFGASIGLSSSGEGSATVSGSGSAWTVASQLVVGGDGGGALRIADGGMVTSNDGLMAAGSGSSGAAAVTGGGSAWDAGFLRVGDLGSAALAISDGGSVTSSAAFLGMQAGGIGSALVTGAGSTWTSSAALTVAEAGEGALMVAGGGTVVSDGGYIGAQAGSQGRVFVTGAGSAWTSTGALTVGSLGSGALTISHGAAVSAVTNVVLAAAAGSQGTLNIGAASGGAAVASGTLDVPLVDLGAGDGRIVFNHTGTNHIFTPEIIGTGRIDLLAGTTELNNAATFSGMTTVHDAILRTNGTLNGTLDVLAGGRLEGVGAVGTATVAGTVAPGNSIGTLSALDYTQAAGSYYEVEIDASGNSDLIDVANIATLDGGTVLVSPFPDFALTTPYTILTAASSLTGTFDGATIGAGSIFLSPELTYDANNAYLTIRQTADFDSVAMTPNQTATAGAAQALGAGNAIHDAIVRLGSTGEARAAFDSLSGEIHASLKSVLAEDSRFVREAALGRMRAAFGGIGSQDMPVLSFGPGGAERIGSTAAHFAAWGQAFGASGRWDSDGNAAELDRTAGGFFLGGDAAVAETWRLGLLAGYSRSDFDADDRASSGTADSLHFGAYGGTQRGAFGLSFGAAYSWHDIEMSRSAAFTGFAQTLASDYDAGTAQIFGEAAYRFETQVGRFEPFLGLAHVSVDADGFSESGGAAALGADSSSFETTFTTLGIRAERDLVLAGTEARAYGMLGWRHAFGDTTPATQLHFMGGDTFTVAGVPIAQDAAVMEAGLDFDLTSSASLAVSYSGRVGGGMQDHALRARLSAAF